MLNRPLASMVGRLVILAGVHAATLNGLGQDRDVLGVPAGATGVVGLGVPGRLQIRGARLERVDVERGHRVEVPQVVACRVVGVDERYPSVAQRALGRIARVEAARCGAGERGVGGERDGRRRSRARPVPAPDLDDRSDQGDVDGLRRRYSRLQGIEHHRAPNVVSTVVSRSATVIDAQLRSAPAEGLTWPWKSGMTRTGVVERGKELQLVRGCPPAPGRPGSPPRRSGGSSDRIAGSPIRPG